MLRRTKKEVAGELPAKTTAVIKCRLSAWQAEQYKQMSEQGALLLSGQSGKVRPRVVHASSMAMYPYGRVPIWPCTHVPTLCVQRHECNRQWQMPVEAASGTVPMQKPTAAGRPVHSGRRRYRKLGTGRPPAVGLCMAT